MTYLALSTFRCTAIRPPGVYAVEHGTRSQELTAPGIMTEYSH